MSLMRSEADLRVAVIGVGYVGLPVAAALGHHFPTIGFDTNSERVAALNQGEDETGEVTAEDLAASSQLSFASDVAAIADANFFIVTVPTPIDDFNRPDLTPLIAASKMVGSCLKKGDIVVYESTVYPGATEENCVPVLEETSDLRFNSDFFVGYSPERMNPGDKDHSLTNIMKVTSGSTPETADFVDHVYKKIVRAGTHKVSSIRVAEAAKVIENIQRDVNIALINELTILFGRLGLDSEEVLGAAQTKWNFLPFRPGLVGGHCIGVDPYYLTHKAQEVKYHPEVILAGRRINDFMGTHAAGLVLDEMMRRGKKIKGSNILVLGLTFKEDCPDIRNTRVVDIIEELCARGANVDVFDPHASAQEAKHVYGLSLNQSPSPSKYDAAVIAVAHNQFKEMGENGLRGFLNGDGILVDLKWTLTKDQSDVRL